MKLRFRPTTLILISGLFLSIISATTAHAITGIEVIGPVKHNLEAWTVTVGGQNHDKALLSYTDPTSGEIFWGLTSELSGNTYGIILRTARNGSVIWSFDIKDLYEIYFVKPQDMLISNDGKWLYVLIEYSNDTNGDRIGMLELYAQNGTMAGFSFLNIKTLDNTKMDWITNERILIATEQRRSPSGSDCMLIIYNTLVHNSSNFHQITTSNLYNVPMSLECEGLDNKNILTVYTYDAGGVPSTWMYSINYTGGKLGISFEKQIVPDSPSYKPLGAISYGSHIYLMTYFDFVYCLVSLNTNFVVEFKTKWNLADVSWNSMAIDSKGTIILAGSGKQSFNLESYTETQGILTSYSLNPTEDNFVIAEINRFGEPDTADSFMDLELSSKGELYIAGYGRSYGTAPLGDDDAYLIKWNTVADPCSTCNTSIFNTEGINWQVILVISVIGCVTIIVVITSIANIRKNKEQ